MTASRRAESVCWALGFQQFSALQLIGKYIGFVNSFPSFSASCFQKLFPRNMESGESWWLSIFFLLKFRSCFPFSTDRNSSICRFFFIPILLSVPRLFLPLRSFFSFHFCSCLHSTCCETSNTILSAFFSCVKEFRQRDSDPETPHNPNFLTSRCGIFWWYSWRSRSDTRMMMMSHLSLSEWLQKWHVLSQWDLSFLGSTAPSSQMKVMDSFSKATLSAPLTLFWMGSRSFLKLTLHSYAILHEIT